MTQFRSLEGLGAVDHAKQILLIGLNGAAPSGLREALIERGAATKELQGPADLELELGVRRPSTLVVYGAERAQRVLEILIRFQRSSPVVVLGDRERLGDYFCLMNSGALEFYDVREDLETIVRGIEWAHRTRAS